MDEVMAGLPPVFREAARVCLELAEKNPARLEEILARLVIAVDFYKRRQTDEFSPESLVALK